MSDRIEWFSITIPKGTAAATPLVTACVFQQGDVLEVDIVVPPGPSGTVGFFIGAGGSQYIPRTRGSFVVADSEYIQWPLTNAITSGSWSVTAYNTDIWDHTIQVGFQINEVGDARTPGSQSPGASSADLTAALPIADLTVLPPTDPLSPDFLISTVPDLSGVTP